MALSIVLIVICVIFSAFFSAAESALSSLNHIRLKSMAGEGNKRAKAAMWFEDHLSSMFTTILIGNTLANVIAATVSVFFWLEAAKLNWGATGAVSAAVMLMILLVFGEVSPKILAGKAPEKFVSIFAPLLRFFYYAFYPLNFLMKLLKALLDKLFKEKKETAITDDELMTIVDEAQTEGGLDEYEGRLIRSAIEFDDRTVVDILTPRVEVEAIEKGTPMEKVLSVYRETGYTRLPVYVDSIDNVVGVINEKDFLNLYLDGAGSFDPIITPVVCATPRMKISVLLRRLQKEKSHLAVVVDEFGGTMGVVTMEDIIEELVGEIWDEHDEVVENFAKVDEGRYFVQGEVTLADFFEYFGIRKDPSEFETVTLGGLIAQLAGKVPAVGEEVKFENLTLKVLSVEYYKVTQAEVTVSSTQEGAKSRSEEE